MWTMNVEQLVWWWTQGWALWTRQHGADPEAKAAAKGDSPDKAAIRAAYGGTNIGR